MIPQNTVEISTVALTVRNIKLSFPFRYYKQLLILHGYDLSIRAGLFCMNGTNGNFISIAHITHATIMQNCSW